MSTDLQPVRRATVEDVPALMELWSGEGLDGPALERRFQNFQVLPDASGKALAACGLEVLGKDALLYAEVFAHPEDSDAQRALLLDRFRTIARTHGLERLWIQSDAVFWHRNGFELASDKELEKKPHFTSDQAHPWRLVKLRPDSDRLRDVELEFEVFREMERAETAKMFDRAKTLRIIALVLALVVTALGAIWILTFMKFRNRR